MVQSAASQSTTSQRATTTQLATDSQPGTVRPPRRRHRGLIVLGVLALAIVLLILLWNWDWFIPTVESRASAAIGRKVTIAHLHVRLGRQTTVAADDVVVANPDGFAATAPLARVGRLTVLADVMQYLQHDSIVLPAITLDRPDIHATGLADGTNNWTLKFPAAKPDAKPVAPPQIGNVQINGGIARVIDAKLRSDFAATIATRPGTAGQPDQIAMQARGTYAAQPITAGFAGGALLSLRDPQHPYPVNLQVANGPTKMSLVGTIENPLSFAGARLKLSISGPDLADLLPLTGVAIPPSPPFSISGNLDYAPPKFRFSGFNGRVGSSDLGGEIDFVPVAGSRPDVTMDVRSRRLDLADLAGFVGAPPGRADVAGQTAVQKQEKARALASHDLFSHTPISLPKIRAANIHVRYRAEHIENKYTPFDRLSVVLDIVDGRIEVHPLDFVVGDGDIASTISLAPGARDIIHTDATVAFRHLDLQRLMAATHSFKGRGVLGGEARLSTNGNSVASMLGQGNGELKLVLVSAGNVSALLIDVAGLEFGNALLSAIGMPNRAKLDCFVADMPLHDGVIDTKAFLLDTEEGRVTGTGTIDLRDQTLHYALTTRAKHFSVGSLPGPINLTGPIASPSIRPGAEVFARAGAAAGLGIVLTPLGALLPTIQFGIGKDNACAKAEAAEHQPIAAPHPPARRAHR